jgi:MarR family transcriptional repressor of emrRAB
MARDLSRFERSIARLAQKHPRMPRDTVMLIRLAYHAFLALDERLEAHFNRHRLTGSSWVVLMMIYSSAARRVSPSELSAAVVQSRTHMTRVADDLADKGLIRRVPGVADRRRVELALTPAGLRTIERLLPLTWATYESALDVFGAADRHSLASLLRRWLHYLNDEQAAADGTAVAASGPRKTPRRASLAKPAHARRRHGAGQRA